MRRLLIHCNICVQFLINQSQPKSKPVANLFPCIVPRFKSVLCTMGMLSFYCFLCYMLGCDWSLWRILTCDWLIWLFASVAIGPQSSNLLLWVHIWVAGKLRPASKSEDFVPIANFLAPPSRISFYVPLASDFARKLACRPERSCVYPSLAPVLSCAHLFPSACNAG